MNYVTLSIVHFLDVLAGLCSYPSQCSCSNVDTPNNSSTFLIANLSFVHHLYDLLLSLPLPPSCSIHYSLQSPHKNVWFLTLIMVILAYLATAHDLNSPLYILCRMLFTKYFLFPLHRTLVNKSVDFHCHQLEK